MPDGDSLGSALDREDFLSRVRQAPRRGLLLDYDGTLAPLVADRRRSEPYPGVREALSKIATDGRTRLGIVSGRAAGDLQRVLAAPFRVELWGSHGLEHIGADEACEAPTPRPGAPELLEEASRWIAQRGWALVLERKPFGLALHGRAHPDAFAAAAPALLARWAAPARTVGLELLEFDGGVELRPAGSHKGQVVERVLEELPEGSPVAYLGDDRTDEDAFEAIEGRGLGVLVRPRPRPSRAGALLRPPEELIAFLARWIER
jgi:trehalose 6-phosphate phosphatase